MKKRLAAAVLGTALAISFAAPVLADEIILSYRLQHSVLEALTVDCAPGDLLVTEEGALLVTDTYATVIWKVENGVCSMYAGASSVQDPYGEPMGGYNDAAHPESLFKDPWAITPFLDGWAVSDPENDVVRMLRPDRTETVNASTRENLVISNMGVVFSHPTGLATDSLGNLYISDTGNNAIRMCTSNGNLTTVADGLNEPTGLCWKDGSLYVCETGANRILRIGSGGGKEYLAGSGEDGYADGPAQSASFSSPQGIAVGDDGTVYVSDTLNSAVRRIKGGNVDTVAIRGDESLQTYPVGPRGLLWHDHTLYVCDNFTHRVFLVQP